MVYRGVGLPVLFLLALGIGSAQVYPPGGYPPGGYPGGGYPPGGYPNGYPGGYPGGGGGIPIPSRGGTKPSKKTDTGTPLPNFRGKLKRFEKKTISLELGDNRILDFRRSDKTRFYKNGDEIKDPKFVVGDQISIEGSEDADGSLNAVNVYWEKSAGAGTSTASSGNKDGAAVDTWAKDDPPKTKDDPPKKDDAAAKDASPARTQPPPFRSDPPAAPAREASAEKSPPASRDSDDPGPPTLRRGSVADPKRERAVEPLPQISDAAPPPSGSRPIRAPGEDDDAPAARPGGGNGGYIPIVQRPDDPLIRKAADAAMDFTETLPNYVCQELMSRYQSQTKTPSWQAQDVVGTTVVYENGKEDYRNVTVNGRPKKSIEDTGGAWSTGEFGTVLIDLFSPATNATFKYKKDSRTAGIVTKEYEFTVARENSHWSIHMDNQTYMPSYRGSVWIDPSSSRVLRIEMEALGFPEAFPTDHVESATDYQYIRLGDAKQYLLPVHAETLSCQRGTNYCSRNVIDFRNYRKYTGESTITFGK